MHPVLLTAALAAIFGLLLFGQVKRCYPGEPGTYVGGVLLQGCPMAQGH